MNNQEIVRVLSDWASGVQCITRVFLFGSRAKGNNDSESDLDIAMELEPESGDANGLATWIVKSDRWQMELHKMIPYKIDLQYYQQGVTDTISKGLIDASILAYSRD